MPGFDRTGPQGRGPATGGGRGYCGRRGDVVLGPGAQRGRGRGRRSGAGYGYGYGNADPAYQAQGPDGQTADILDTLHDIQGRLERLERQAGPASLED